MSSHALLPLQPVAPRTAFRSIPLHFSATCFIGALLTDIAYWKTAEMTWADFSAWLLMAGLVLGVVGAIGVVADWSRGVLTTAPLRLVMYFGCLLAAFLLGFLNTLIHSRDAWTSVVPTGLATSIATFVAIVIAALLGAGIQRHPAEEVMG
ncbi:MULTISPECIES: DUF2231 domain-containing protein [unclassified Rhizobium]|uniref:DUF2231 domain-containing protein n=1 Tax=unclassified Rhizobium TaxID=2613769 RepID=UPI0021676752|nr:MULTISPECIES: DUF2231 domain-containing protein [unclassified Rhizobium]MCS3741663.1 putative membrane protein [Rhizobium sp. BK661]MCS4093614.1 putative membrane protein [Rhizobium sp. BK176]